MIPRFVATEEEQRARSLGPGRERIALGLFRQGGVLALGGAVAEADRTAWRQAIGGVVPPAGLEISGALAGTGLWANPIVLPLLRRLLGQDCVLGAFGLIGAEPPRRPGPLYPGVDDASLPCYAVRLLIPLDGADLFLADHRAAWSPPSLALELVYCRAWFLDVDGRRALVMPAAEYEQAPDEHRELLARIGSERAQRLRGG
jgi:hypothetical protein